MSSSREILRSSIQSQFLGTYSSPVPKYASPVLDQLQPHLPRRGRLKNHQGGLTLMLCASVIILIGSLMLPVQKTQPPIHLSMMPAQIQQVLGATTRTQVKYYPVRLIIPRLNINTKIEKVGVTVAGEMEVPYDTTSVGWFGSGVVPGETGSAVFDGHLNTKTGLPGIFSHLGLLQVGDKLYVEDNSGGVVTFIVRGSRNYNPGYADEVFSESNGSHLNLITCEGWWDSVKKSYSKRLVVFTDLEK